MVGMNADPSPARAGVQFEWTVLLRLAAAAVVALVSAGSALAQADDPVRVRAVPERAVVVPGDQIAVAVVFEFAPGWHAWPNQPVVPAELAGVEPVPTRITGPRDAAGNELPRAPGAALLAGTSWTQWPEAHEVETAAFTGEPLRVLSYAGTSVAYVPVQVDPAAAPGRYTVELVASYQACDETTCLIPAQVAIEVPIEVVPAGTAPAAAAIEPELFAAFDRTVFGRMSDGGPAPGAEPGARVFQFDFLGWQFGVRGNAYALILSLAFVAGLLLNFTPCVLPVIPIKVMSLQAQAKTPGRLALLGVTYCLGIIATFGVLGLLAFGLITGGRQLDWGQLFASSWFVVLMAGVVAAMALGMMGLFQIRLPQAVYMINPSHDSAGGSFLFGVLTAILSTPCTGPLLGATIAWILTQPAWLGLSTFVVMGAGMASPYALLIASPRLIERLPRSGPGGEVMKQVIGVLMLAVAAFLAGNLTSAKWPWWVVGGLVAAAGAWWIVQSWRLLRRPKWKIVNTALALGMIAATAPITASLAREDAAGDDGVIPWRTLTNPSDAEVREAIEAAVGAGRAAVVDFTAKWCTNCHVIENAVLNSEAGRALLTRPDVAPIKVDLTTAGPEQGWGVVREISGGGGIPLIAVFRPGAEGPTYFQSFFKVSDLERAVRGPAAR